MQPVVFTESGRSITPPSRVAPIVVEVEVAVVAVAAVAVAVVVAVAVGALQTKSK